MPAYVIGSGPNGLTAGIELARAGYSTTIIEARNTIGGGAHSAELTLPGFVHDVCSAVHPMALSSPVFKSYPLKDHGLEWIEPQFPLAHPLDDGDAAVIEREIEATAKRLGEERRYARIAHKFVQRWPRLMAAFLGPMIPPRSPVLMARLGLHLAGPATWEARRIFRGKAGRALFAGLAAHSQLPLEWAISSAFGWMMGAAAHAVGWPIPRGGSQSIANALASYFQSFGGAIVTGQRVRSLAELTDGQLILCDVGAAEFLRLAGDRLPAGYRKSLQRFRPGPAAFKLDWALSAPIPWRNADCMRAGTVHLGGTLEEIAESERAPWHGEAYSRPFIILVQPSLFDSSRAPKTGHTAWAYCHVPNGSKEDMAERMEAQVERFAPGFRTLILKRHVMFPADFEQLNPNFSGGDVVGGANNLWQFAFRPTRHLYRTPLRGVYLCSASTPPGGAVHGMCGYHAAHTAMRDQPALRR